MAQIPSTTPAVNLPPGLVPLHRHAVRHLAVVRAGAYFEMSAYGRFRLRPGLAVLHEAYVSHANLVEQGGIEVANIAVSADIHAPGRVVELPSWAHGRAWPRSGAELAAGLEDARPTSPEPAPDWLLELAAAIRDGEDFAAASRRLGVSREHAQRAYRNEFGSPPGAVRREQRLLRALELLREGAPIGQCAAEAGYADQSHLTREVKSATGLTPAASRSPRVTAVQDSPVASKAN